MNFWQKLPKPFFALAPMAGVTDFAFREIIAKYGKPDIMWTEFVSADGLVSAGKKRLLIDLKFSDKERPIVAQLFGGNSETVRKAAALVAKLGFDGLDINMGCPDKSVEKQGGGAAMIKDFKKAIEVIRAAREGVGAPAVTCRRRVTKSAVFNSPIPVSVKTRLGYNKVDWDWIRLLLEQKLPAITIHLRTRKEMSKAPAHWELMPKIIKMRNEINPETLIIGNGDIETVEDGILKCKKYGCDGIMIGRGIFGKPWLFNGVHGSGSRKSRPSRWRQVSTLSERSEANEDTSSRRGGSDLRLEVLLVHAKLFEKTFCGKKRLKSFDIMKKHFKTYVSGRSDSEESSDSKSWDGAKELRVKLMGTKNYKEVKKVVVENLRLREK